MTNEKILLNYRQKKSYTITKLNEIGANTSETLRTVTAYDDDNCMHVRKFGIAYEITQVTDIEDPGSPAMKFWVYALDGTLLGSRVGGGAFVAGTTSSTAQACYLKVTGTGSTTMLTTVLIDTDVDAGGKDFVFPAEPVVSYTDIDFYLSETTSTYYDEDLKYGGARHTPDGTEALPYFKIQDALTACGGALTIVTVLDSETYDEELTFDGAWTLQAALGQTPTITCGIGARVTREVQHDGNNTDTAYVSKDGDDSTGAGTWSNPYLTIGEAITSIGARTYINIKDSGTYVEIVDFTSSDCALLEPIYGKTPIINGYINNKNTVAGLTVTQTTKNSNGIILITPTTEEVIYVYDCTVHGCYDGIIKNKVLTVSVYVTIERCLVYDCINSGILVGNTFSASVKKNIVFNSNNGIFIENITTDCTVLVHNNYCYKNTKGIHLKYNGSATGTRTIDINNNTSCGNTGHGFYHYDGYALTNNPTKNIFYDNGEDVYSEFTLTITYSNYGTKNANVTATNCITTDPVFCDSDNDNYGIPASSGAYKTDGAEGDMGANSRNILVSATGAIINGFIIDGRSQYLNSIGKTGATDYAVLTVKWCDIKNFLGIAIDDYSGSETTGSFDNNKIYDNGSGINILKGATSISQNLIYANSVHNIYCNGNLVTFDHNVLFGAQYGLYVATSGVIYSFKNSVTYQNSVYGVYSASSAVNIFYSDINDSYNSNVNISDYSNFNVNPLFMSLISGSEDFNLKCFENGSLYNSSLIEMADDGYDIGAWLVSRAMTGYSWKKYQLAHNGKNVSFEDSMKGLSVTVGANGTTSVYGYGEKRKVKIGYPQGQYVTEILRKKIQYFSTLIKTKSNGLTNDEIKFRVHYLPDQFLASGTATIDATEKSIYDSTVQWNENEFRGWHVGVKFTSGTGMVIDATAKTGTKSGAGWTANQWTGYYFYYLGYYYYIASNTTEALTFLDPDGTLTSGTVAYAVEKYFKITSNTENVLYLSDPDSELEDGSLGYYIDFIEMKIVDPKFSFSQPRFYYQKETWKNGFEITLEEV